MEIINMRGICAQIVIKINDVKVPQGGEWNEMRGPSTGAGIMQRFNG
jgi:hypothetical protein